MDITKKNRLNRYIEQTSGYWYAYGGSEAGVE